MSDEEEFEEQHSESEAVEMGEEDDDEDFADAKPTGKRSRGRAAAKPKEGKRAKGDILADAALVAARLPRAELEKLFVELADEAVLKRARLLLPEVMQTAEIRELKIATAPKPIFTAAGEGIGVLAGVPTDVLVRIFRSVRFDRYGWRSTKDSGSEPEGLSFKQTYHLLSSTCKSLRVFLADARFFHAVAIPAGRLGTGIRYASGIAGCRRLQIMSSKVTPKVIADDLLSVTLPHLQELSLSGEKLTKAFWTKKMLAAPFWPKLHHVNINPEKSKAVEAFSGVISDLFSKMPQLTVVELPANSLRAAASGISQGRGGGKALVREVHSLGGSYSFMATNFFGMWNSTLEDFPEMEALYLHGNTQKPSQARALRPCERMRHLEIRLYTTAYRSPQVDIDEALQHFPEIVPNLRSLKLGFDLSDWSRPSKERKREPASSGTVNLNPLSRMPLEHIILKCTLNHEIKPASMSEWPESRLAENLRIIEISGPVRNREKFEATRPGLSKFLAENFPKAKVIIN